MKAVRLLEYGGRLVFNDVPAPTIAPDEILVKIKSTAVNHLDLVEASGRQDRYSRSTCRGYPVMSFRVLSNRLAVTLRNGRQVMSCSVPTQWVARTRSIWRSSRQSSHGNRPASPLRRRHPCP